MLLKLGFGVGHLAVHGCQVLLGAALWGEYFVQFSAVVVSFSGELLGLDLIFILGKVLLGDDVLVFRLDILVYRVCDAGRYCEVFLGVLDAPE